MALTPVVVALTAAGGVLGREIADKTGARLDGREGRVVGADAEFQSMTAHLASLFLAGHPVIAVCSAGIVIRALAPHLSDKRAEPPVLVVAEDASAVVPLLGGHRGANALAQKIAQALGRSAAVTTAGELSIGAALDAPPAGHRLATPHDLGAAMAEAASGGVTGPGAALFGIKPAEGAPVTLELGTAPVPPTSGRLVYHPQRFALGLGSARGADPDALWAFVQNELAQAGIAEGAIAAVGSIDLKADEPAILAVADRLGVPARFFPAARLAEEHDRLKTPSQTVLSEVGCLGVAEGAALALGGPEATLRLPKVKTDEATMALAEAPEPILTLGGRPRGRVSVVGIGPGQAAWRTPEATALVAAADELVGYGLYIDLLGPFAAGKPRADFPLGGEEDRCRYALEEAGKGRDIALICSGDAGIYAMGALVFELLDREREAGGVSDAAQRVEVVCSPGVSAMQAAAARAGAPLGHDFCAISLSDLLTPRDDILKRLKAAAEGDFVIAFYNPVSARRRTLLAEARDILLKHRPVDTPVLLAASLGRPAEQLRYVALADLQVDDVDMLTLVIIGSSASRLVERGEGPRLYTPRGYAAKRSGA